MRFGGAFAGLALLLAAPTARAQQAPTASLNQITRVEVKAGAVEISCAGRPNFTSLNLQAPSRLVLDFADTVLAEKPHEISGQIAGLRSLRTEAFHSETGAVARVVLTLAPDADADIAAAPGNTLRVKVLAAGSTTVARADTTKLDFGKADADARARADAQARADAEAQAKATSDAQARADAETKATAAAQARADAEAHSAAESKARADAEARARLDAEAKAQSESKARVDAEAKAKAAEDKLAKLELERAAAEAKAQSEAKARADAEAQARVERERRESEAKAHADAENARRESEAKAHAEAEARHQKEEAAAAQQARLAQEAIDKQREAQAHAAAEQAERDRQAAAVAQQAERDRRAQTQQAHAQAQADAEARAEQSHLAEQHEAERAARLAEGRAAAQAQPLPARPETRVASAAPTDHVAVRAGLKDISLVGFKQGGQGGRVFIRANDAVAYTVTETSPTLLMVEVQDARISQRNGALPLDTSFFPGPVALITPSEDKRNRVVRVEIKLKARAAYSARLDGSDVVIEFPDEP